MIYMSDKKTNSGGFDRYQIGWTDQEEDFPQILALTRKLKGLGHSKTRLVYRDRPLLKKRGRDMLLVPEDAVLMATEYLRIGSIPHEYFQVLGRIHKKNRVLSMEDPSVDEVKGLDKVIKQGIVSLLMSGRWIDEPLNDNELKINGLIEKIDLGRRSDLNYSSKQEPTRYLDLNQSQAEIEAVRNPYIGEDAFLYQEYLVAKDRNTVEEFFAARPWLKPTYETDGTI